MNTIKLDASNWANSLDFYDALLPALGSPEWHGKSVNALIDSIIWGGINAGEPPYTVETSTATRLPDDIICEVKLARDALAEARDEFRAARGHDVDVRLELIGDWTERSPCEAPAARVEKAWRGPVAPPKYVIELVEQDDGKLAPRRSSNSPRHPRADTATDE